MKNIPYKIKRAFISKIHSIRGILYNKIYRYLDKKTNIIAFLRDKSNLDELLWNYNDIIIRNLALCYYNRDTNKLANEITEYKSQLLNTLELVRTFNVNGILTYEDRLKTLLYSYDKNDFLDREYVFNHFKITYDYPNVEKKLDKEYEIKLYNRVVDSLEDLSKILARNDFNELKEYIDEI